MARGASSPSTAGHTTQNHRGGAAANAPATATASAVFMADAKVVRAGALVAANT